MIPKSDKTTSPNRYSLAEANDRGKDSLIGHLGIELLAADDDCLTARMPVDSRTCNPASVLHGGASVALAETVGTWAASFCVDPAMHHCVGLEINANHIRPVADGYVYATARPIHRGKRTHIWEIRIADEGAGRSGDWSARIADLLAPMIVQIRRRRQRAAWRREILALDDRQLRDAGIDLNHAVDRETAVREAVTIANLNALR